MFVHVIERGGGAHGWFFSMHKISLRVGGVFGGMGGGGVFFLLFFQVNFTFKEIAEGGF